MSNKHAPTPSESDAKKAEENAAFSRQMSSGYLLGMNLVVSSLVGLGIGIMLDKWLGTAPLFILLFLVLGFVAGLRRMWQSLNQDAEES